MSSEDKRLSTCPYGKVPTTSRWADVVARVAPAALDPHLPARLRLDRQTRIGTAGSCFAQHIARFLVANGFNYFVVEPAPRGFTDQEKTRYNYELFSARYGNVYTALQLVQLFQRAYGRFEPTDGVWQSPDGRWYDLFRPRVQPRGFASERELLADQAQHFKAIRRLFETLDVFVFTLGLTESWRDRRDGAIYPICPGCGAGEFDPDRYEFHNFTAAEVTDHLDQFVAALRQANPRAEMILTVSPVPLVATYEPRHVLQATVYSKAVLRVAAEETIRKHANVHYFGSYEIITSTYQTQTYFADDRRTVTEPGLAHVMRTFLRHFVGETLPSADIGKASHKDTTVRQNASTSERGPDIVCDEADFFAAVTGQQNARR